MKDVAALPGNEHSAAAAGREKLKRVEGWLGLGLSLLCLGFWCLLRLLFR